LESAVYDAFCGWRTVVAAPEAERILQLLCKIDARDAAIYVSYE